MVQSEMVRAIIIMKKNLVNSVFRRNASRAEPLSLRPISTVQLIPMQKPCEKSRTRVGSCKSYLQLACDCLSVPHEECRGF